jgi:hypothetical protein
LWLAACGLFIFLILLHKLLYPSFGIDELLLSGKEGMTVGANIHMDIWLGRTRMNGVATGTDNRGFDVFGVQLLLHR